MAVSPPLALKFIDASTNLRPSPFSSDSHWLSNYDRMNLPFLFDFEHHLFQPKIIRGIPRHRNGTVTGDLRLLDLQ